MGEMQNPSNLTNTFVVLDSKMAAETVTVSDRIYAELDERYDNFKDHLLISSYFFDENWSVWEVHPHGDEIVCLLSGDAEFVLRQGAIDATVRLNVPGSFVVVPRNTWHTAIIHAPAKMIFITPGEGTENRERPPE